MGVRAVGWSEEEDTELHRLLGLKHTVREIAALMSKQFNRHFTRSTVVGRMFRMRKRGKMTPAVKPIVVKKVVKVEQTPSAPKLFATSSLTNAIKANTHPMMFRRKPNPNEPKPVPRLPDSVSKHNCTLEQLTKNTCRFPFGGVNDVPPYIYCGDVTFGEASFCKPHCEVCFTPSGMDIALAKTKHTRT